MKTDSDNRVRHPEKQANKSTFSKKPSWIRVKVSNNPTLRDTVASVRGNRLNTVCEEAACPNLSECWSRKHASFIVLGDICTRGCAFCNITTGKPDKTDDMEPIRVAQSVVGLGLKHVVITSVNRDDLPDKGAWHFVKCIASIRYKSPNTTIEILTPDFSDSIDIIMDNAIPDVFNHNIETVPRLYRTIRPGSRYFRSLNLLYSVKGKSDIVFTKSGMMVGLGETDEEVYQVMDDLISAGVDFLTIGQYLQPTPKHHPVERYVHPDIFKKYEKIAYSKGFLMVSASPLTRSSYHADSDFAKLKLARQRLDDKNS